LLADVTADGERMLTDLRASLARARAFIVARVVADVRAERDREQLARLATYGGVDD
jgi:hypothetical protein